MKNPFTFIVVVTKGKGKEIFGFGALLLEHKLLDYVIAWIITARGE